MALSVRLDQWQDGPAPDGDSTGNNNEGFVNGNLNHTKAHYAEGDSIPYRAVMDDLQTGHTYSIRIQWDTVDSGAYAIDYLTSYNFTFEGTKHPGEPDVTPTVGVNDISSNTFSTVLIPSDDQLLTGFGDQFGVTDGLDSGQPSGDQFITIFGAVTDLSTSEIIYSPDGTKASILVTFTYTGSSANNADSVVIAWGGHIASSADWSDDPGEDVETASDISGSPYHTRVLNLVDNGQVISVGNQDRSLSASAVVPSNPALTIDKAFVNVTGGDGDALADAVGDILNYTVTVTNTGDVTLTGVTVVDPLTGQNVSGVTLAPGASQVYNTSYTLTQDDLDGEGNAGSDNDIDNTATADSDQTGPASDSATVPLVQTRALAIDKQFVDVTGGDGDGLADAVGDVINYQMLVTNEGNTALDNVVVTDPLLGGVLAGPDSGDTDTDGRLDVGETWVYTGSYTVTQADLDGEGNAGADHDIDNTATASADDTPPDDDSEEVDLSITPALAIVKVADKTFVVSTSDVITYTYTVTNTGNTSLSNVVVTDDNFTPIAGDDFNPTFIPGGDTDGDGKLDVNETWTYTSTHQVTQAELNAGVDLVNVATADSDETGPATDDATVDVIEPPITVTGNPQFNFPNDVDKIQPKLQGGSFTLNSNAYIYWDLFTSNTDLAQIDLNPATYSSDYAGLTISIVKIWEDTGLKDAVYRVYVANENDDLDVSLANNTNIVDYNVIQANGTPVLSTNKGLIDLINSDPLIGNFNNFNNIENALTKDATNGILTNPASPTGDLSNKVWSSPDESGTAINELPKDFDTQGGNDALYGRNNTGTETLTGGTGNDMIDGRDGGDVINGGDGNDYLYGGLGNDTISGGAGNDTLIGSYGINDLTGNAGQDIFVVRQGTFTTIHDFDPTDDQIWVWVDTLNTTGAPTAAGVEYDQDTGFLSVDDTVIAFLEGSPDNLILGVNFNSDIFVT